MDEKANITNADIVEKKFQFSNDKERKDAEFKQIEYLLFKGPPKNKPLSPKNNPNSLIDFKNKLEQNKIDYQIFIDPIIFDKMFIKNILAKKAKRKFLFYEEKCNFYIKNK